jgi:hypothetical protein
MSMAGSDITVEILKDIRQEIRNTNQRLDTVESTLNQRLGAVESTLQGVESTLNTRLGSVETTLLDLAEQQRFVVRYTKAISERDARMELRLTALETRVDKLESK